MQLRFYQEDAVRDVKQAWADGHRVVMLRMPTGGGKTPTFGKIISEEPGGSVVIAHRSELVYQASIALAKYGLRHRIIGPPTMNRICSALHMYEFGKTYLETSSRTAVASVDTIINRSSSELKADQVRKWVVDEGHHLLRENKWGRAVGMFKHALGLAVTATPGRPDGKGLGSHADGLADILIEGPETHDLIDIGYLSKYKIYCPQSDVDITSVPVKASGDFDPLALAKAIHKSNTIVGDIVDHYLRIAPGELGVTFCVDVEAATEQAAAFRQKGVPAEVITGNTPPDLRSSIMRRFRNHEILQITNVGVLGEGTDVPVVRVVSMGCHTASYTKYAQEKGRMMRLLLDKSVEKKWDHMQVADRLKWLEISKKPYGILIDHVGNALRHEDPPECPRQWSLDRRDKRSSKKSDAIPLRVCVNAQCVQPYERTHRCCPYCGTYPEPAARSSPEYVDGDLLELDMSTLMAMRGEIERIDGSPAIPYGASEIVAAARRKQHWERQQAQGSLRSNIAWWAGLQEHLGLTESQSYRKFYFKFGVDVAGCQTLGAREAGELNEKIQKELIDNNVNTGVI